MIGSPAYLLIYKLSRKYDLASFTPNSNCQDFVIIELKQPNLTSRNPEPLLKALQQLDVEPEKAVMIGDTEVDILAGKNAKVMTIGVCYGFHGSPIAESKPDFIIEDIADIIPVLPHIKILLSGIRCLNTKSNLGVRHARAWRTPKLPPPWRAATCFHEATAT